MIVTPKEIDDLIEKMKDVIAKRNKLRSITISNFKSLSKVENKKQIYRIETVLSVQNKNKI